MEHAWSLITNLLKVVNEQSSYAESEIEADRHPKTKSHSTQNRSHRFKLV